jgi:hypothetical protein
MTTVHDGLGQGRSGNWKILEALRVGALMVAEPFLIHKSSPTLLLYGFGK